MRRLNISVTEIPGRMRIETPSGGSVITQLVCLNCPVTIFGRHFDGYISKTGGGFAIDE
ncbi:cellular nucleic acid-binding protein, partial [Trifolium medium]|nr:cellular nucleic acid-binding protein [Trifolium medium]